MKHTPFLLLLVACTKIAPSAAADAGPVATSAPVVEMSSLPTTIAAPRARTYRASYADITKDELGECVDVNVEATLAPDAGEPKHNPAEAVFKNAKGLTKLSKPCAEQFADRMSFATCTFGKHDADGGTSVDVQVVSHRYDFAAVADTDRYMKECLEMHGEWDAIPRDSAEWRAAKAEQTRRRLERLTR